MSDQQDETSASPPTERKIRYYQREIYFTEHLYLNGRSADVNFLFRSDGIVTCVPAHKCLLAGNSDVFDKMFYDELKGHSDIMIVDSSAAAFTEFLQFFYLSNVTLSYDHIVEVMYLGNKYNVEKCSKILQNTLSTENVCSHLSLAILYDQKVVVKAFVNHILVDTTAIFASAGFLECSKEALAYILRMDLLSCSEAEVFEACMAWVRAKSKQSAVSKATVEQYLGNLYYEIRFASMTVPEFCALKKKYTAVLASDFETIVELIAQSSDSAVKFNTAKRQVNWNEDKVIECDRATVSPVNYTTLNTEERTSFSTSDALLLGSFKYNEILVDDRPISNLLVEVEIYESTTFDNENATILLNFKANLQSRRVSSVSLPHPILIQPDFYYTICIRNIPDICNQYRSCELNDNVRLNSSIDVYFDHYGDYFGGLIYSLSFNEI